MHTELRVSPAAERNKKPILQVLRSLLPATARVLEIAAGTGQHAAHFAKEQPGWQWQPTDIDPTALPGIAAHSEKLANVLPPLQLDVLAPWPPNLGLFDAVYCANMLHIAPWSTCAALMEGAASHLVESGHLVLYGPFIVEGEPTADSNLAFDADLRQRNPQWGLRKLGMVTEAAQTMGLSLTQGVAMPANNLLLVFRRTTITR